MIKRIPLAILALSGAFGLTACQSQPSLTPVPGSSEEAMLWIRPTLVRPALFRGIGLQAHVNEVDASDIARLEIIPYWHPENGEPRPLSLASGEPTTGDDPQIVRLMLSGTDLAAPRAIALTGLRRRQRYRLVAHAYSDAEERISDPQQSTIQVSVGDDDRPSLPTLLPVKLLPTPFSGRMPLELAVNDPRGRAKALELTVYQVMAFGESLLGAPTVIPCEGLPRLITVQNLAARTSYRLEVAVRGADEEAPPLAVSELSWSMGEDDEAATRSVTVTLPSDGD